MESNPPQSPSLPVEVRRVRVTSGSQLPRDLSQTPGGTLFSTTPGGTRIVYDREFLLSRRDSPLARSPPAGLARIPGVTCPIEDDDSNELIIAKKKTNGDAKTPSSSSCQADKSAGASTEFHIDDV